MRVNSRRLAAGLATAVAAASVLAAGTARATWAETPGCAAVVTIPGCGSWETAAGPDLDVFQAKAVSGTPAIVFTPSTSDKALDWTLVAVPLTDHPLYGLGNDPINAGVGGTWVNIEYTPDGHAITPHLCLSAVDPVIGQADQLRPCPTGSEYNEFQTFLQVAQVSDGTAFSFADYLTAAACPKCSTPVLYMTDSNHPSGIGRVGHRTDVISWPKATSLTEFQLWSQS